MKTPISRFTVNGNSMHPTLHPGQDILSFNWAYLGKKPKVGDIIIVKSGKGKGEREIIKRVIKIMGDELWMMGDNADESTDSRDFGPVKMEQIMGKVIYRSNEVPCPQCGSEVLGIYGRKDAICGNCGFKLACCGEP